MSFILLSEASSGAPRCSGTNGDLCALLDWALVQKGWAIEYTATNARVYRPGSGLRNRLHVYHDSAVSGDPRVAVVRGCEGASSATALTDPFPLVSQMNDSLCNWIVSNTASTATRRFYILLTETFVCFLSNFGATTDIWDIGFFGDAVSPLSTDPYATLCMTRFSSSFTNQTGFNQSATAVAAAGNNLYWCRDVSGSTKSTRGNVYSPGGFTSTTSAPAARSGYLNAVYREKVGFNCGGGQAAINSMAMVKRGFWPNVWVGIHQGKGTLVEADTFTDLTYNPLATFRFVSSASAPGASGIIIEETDTWVSP